MDKNSIKQKNSSKKQKYVYPQEITIKYNSEKYFANPPNSKYWVHGIQTDDKLDNITERRTDIITKLKQIKIPVQRSKEWFSQRSRMITASDIGTALGINHYEPQYKVILKKLITIPFAGEKACYHGKKYETIAAQIYSYRMNVMVYEYGCIEDSCGFLGASPDRIVDVFKLDNIHKTNLVGRMVEIKCVDTRKINMRSHDIKEIIPEYYYPQPQIQMQCCDLDECDFFQCNIKEYANREEFINDTDPEEPFKSKMFGHEKGVIIQLIPFGNIDNKGIKNMIYNHTKFLYPKKIEMTPYECDLWIADALSKYKEQGMNLDDSLTTFQECDNPNDFIVEQIIYWKLIESRCVLVKRDRKWFSNNFPILKKLWDYVLFFRKNETQKKQFIDYVKYIEENYDIEECNEKIMKYAFLLSDIKNKNYEKNIAAITKEINTIKSPQTINCDFDGFELCS
jgi:putative phage-type endonuclease